MSIRRRSVIGETSSSGAPAGAGVDASITEKNIFLTVRSRLIVSRFAGQAKAIWRIGPAASMRLEAANQGKIYRRAFGAFFGKT